MWTFPWLDFIRLIFQSGVWKSHLLYLTRFKKKLGILFKRLDQITSIGPRIDQLYATYKYLHFHEKSNSICSSLYVISSREHIRPFSFTMIDYYYTLCIEILIYVCTLNVKMYPHRLNIIQANIINFATIMYAKWNVKL